MPMKTTVQATSGPIGANRAAIPAAEFPEYDPHENILNRCTTDGNFVQTR